MSLKKTKTKKGDLIYENAGLFMHCKSCMTKFLGSDLHKMVTPQAFGMYEVSGYEFTYPDGTAANIVVVWCKRCGNQVWDSRHLAPMEERKLDKLYGVKRATR